MEQKVIESYKRLKNLKLVGQEIGVPFQTVYIMLRRAGVAVIGDKARYGSEKDRLAASAESEFAKLVPSAVNMNEVKFQSKVDFLVGSMKVDIKSSTLRKVARNTSCLRWAFSVKKQEFIADFLVCFAFKADGTYRLLLIPGEFIRHYQSISIPENGTSKWFDYEINPGELAQFFEEAKGVIQ